MVLRSRQNCPCIGLLEFFYFQFSMLYLSWHLIAWAAVCLVYFCFIILSSFWTKHLAFPAYYACTNLVSLSLPGFMYSLRPTAAAHCMSTPVRRINVHHFVFRCSILTSAFRWWIHSIVKILVSQSVFSIF